MGRIMKQIYLDALEDSYHHLSHYVKMKRWEKNGHVYLYIRVRSHEDQRRFDEYCVVIEEGEP